MHDNHSEIFRKERVLFDLACNINELVKSELSISDINQIEDLFKKFRLSIEAQLRPVFI